MKNLFLSSLITFSSLALAQETVVEFDRAAEVRCYEVIKSIGCTNQAGDEVSACVEKNLAKLNSECKAIHQAKKSTK